MRREKATAADIGREAQQLYEYHWNRDLDLGMGMSTYLLELALTVVPTGTSLQFLDDQARAAAMAAIDDRKVRAAMLNASLTPRPKGKRGGARDRLLWEIRDVLNAAGIIVVHINEDAGDMLVLTRPEGL